MQPVRKCKSMREAQRRQPVAPARAAFRRRGPRASGTRGAAGWRSAAVSASTSSTSAGSAITNLNHARGSAAHCASRSGSSASDSGLPLCASLGLTLYCADVGVERRRRRGGAVGLDLDADTPGAGPPAAPAPRACSSGSPPVITSRVLPQRRDPRRGVLLRERHLVGGAVERGAVAVGPVVAGEAPGVGGVAPHAGEIAARQPHERARLARRGALPLQRSEDLGLAGNGGGERQHRERGFESIRAAASPLLENGYRDIAAKSLSRGRPAGKPNPPNPSPTAARPLRDQAFVSSPRRGEEGAALPQPRQRRASRSASAACAA